MINKKILGLIGLSAKERKVWFGADSVETQVKKGKVKINEDIKQAAIRETLEETGYNIDLNNILLIQNYITNRGVLLIIYFYATLSDSRQVEYRKNEISNVKWFTLEEIKNKFLQMAKESNYGYFEYELKDYEQDENNPNIYICEFLDPYEYNAEHKKAYYYCKIDFSNFTIVEFLDNYDFSN